MWMMVVMMTGEVVGIGRVTGVELGAICLTQHYVIDHVTV